MIAYCDYIAHLIGQIRHFDTQGIAADIGSPKYDLDADGALASTRKTILVTDLNGKMYQITVEEV